MDQKGKGNVKVEVRERIETQKLVEEQKKIEREQAKANSKNFKDV